MGVSFDEIDGVIWYDVAEIAEWKFTPGRICEQLMADYTAEVHVAQ